MRIKAGTSQAFLVEQTEDEQDWLDDFLTFTTVVWAGGKRREHSRSYLGYKGRFPVGLVPMVKRHAEKQGMTVTVDDTRSDPPPGMGLDVGWLRDYQAEAVAKCIDRTRGVVSSPTGSGKGEMITALVMSRDARWLVLVHRDHLVQDLGKRYQKRSGDEPGWIRSGKFDVEGRRVVYATFQSFRKALDKVDPESFTGVIVDEAHTVAADTFNECIQELRRTYYRFGFSGTPFDRTDARSIAVIAAVGPKIYTIKTQMLIEQGYIPRPIIRMVPCVQGGTNQKKFATVYKHTVEQSKVRNEACLAILGAMEKPGIAFVKKRAHGLALTKMAGEAGMNVAYVDGKSSKLQRQSVIDAVDRGAIDVLMSTVVFQEGLDLPVLRSTANLAGGQSVIEILQRLGRGMRKEHAGDHTFEVWDVFDVVDRPKGSTKQKWLQKHSRARAMAMAREGHEIMIGEPGEEGHVFDPDARLTWGLE